MTDLKPGYYRQAPAPAAILMCVFLTFLIGITVGAALGKILRKPPTDYSVCVLTASVDSKETPL